MILIQTEDFVVSFALCNPIKLFFSIGGGRIPVGGNPRVPCLEWVCQDCFLEIYDENFNARILKSTNHFSTNVSLLMHSIHTQL